MIVYRVTRLENDGSEPNAYGRLMLASHKNPVWLLRIDGDVGNRGDLHWLHGGSAKGREVRRELGDHGWALTDNGNGDKWTIVPENEWPDEVCAAIAKKALMGEIE